MFRYYLRIHHIFSRRNWFAQISIIGVVAKLLIFGILKHSYFLRLSAIYFIIIRSLLFVLDLQLHVNYFVLLLSFDNRYFTDRASWFIVENPFYVYFFFRRYGCHATYHVFASATSCSFCPIHKSFFFLVVCRILLLHKFDPYRIHF